MELERKHLYGWLFIYSAIAGSNWNTAAKLNKEKHYRVYCVKMKNNLKKAIIKSVCRQKCIIGSNYIGNLVAF